jgi:hypothetical protein
VIGGQPNASCAEQETLISAFCAPSGGSLVPEVEGNGARCAARSDGQQAPNVTIVCMRN